MKTHHCYIRGVVPIFWNPGQNPTAEIPLSQNPTGQNTTGTKSHRVKIPPGQNATGTKYH